MDDRSTEVGQPFHYGIDHQIATAVERSQTEPDVTAGVQRITARDGFANAVTDLVGARAAQPVILITGFQYQISAVSETQMGSARQRKAQGIWIRTGSQRHIELEMLALKVVRELGVGEEPAGAQGKIRGQKGAPSGLVRAHQVVAEAAGGILSRQHTHVRSAPSEIYAMRTDANVSG